MCFSTTKTSTIIATISLLFANVALAGGHKFGGGNGGGGGGNNRSASRSMNSFKLNNHASSMKLKSHATGSMKFNSHVTGSLKLNSRINNKFKVKPYVNNNIKVNSHINKSLSLNPHINKIVKVNSTPINKSVTLNKQLNLSKKFVGVKVEKYCHDKDKYCHDWFCKPYFDYFWYFKHYCSPIYVRPCPVVIYSCRAYEPLHCWCTVYPGDTLYAISLREYGMSGAQAYIARYNGFGLGSQLVAGQRLMLPSVSASGVMTASNAPAPTSAIAPVAVEKPVVEEAAPKVSAGDTLMVEGQSFGDKPGTARLAVSGLSLPVEVVEWTTSAVKIRLPKVELTSALGANIEVLLSDGSVAASTPIELTPAADRVALGN